MRSKHRETTNRRQVAGQALVEYVLIAGLTFIGMVAVASKFHESMVASNEFYLKLINSIWLF